MIRAAVGAAVVVLVAAAALLFVALRGENDASRGDLLVTAGRVFDGNRVVDDGAVLIGGREVVAVDERSTLDGHAPADLIAVRGNPFRNFQALDDPRLVVARGVVLIRNGNPTQALLGGL